MESFTIRTKVWIYEGSSTPSSNAAAMKGAWHFVTLPKKRADAIKMLYRKQRRGWGSLPVSVTLGSSTWKTSIFPDSKAGSYLLPLKAGIRKKEKIESGDTVALKLKILA